MNLDLKFFIPMIPQKKKKKAWSLLLSTVVFVVGIITLEYSKAQIEES